LQKPRAAATSEPKSAANAAKFTAALSRNLIADCRSRNSHNQLELHNIFWRIISRDHVRPGEITGYPKLARFREQKMRLIDPRAHFGKT
jgi:hypothetical protein